MMVSGVTKTADDALRFLEQAISSGLSRIRPMDQTAIGLNLGFSESEKADAIRWLKSSELIQYKPASEAFAITERGHRRVEERKRMNAPGSKLNDPVPNSLEDIEDEIARWESRQHEGQPGSDWWEQVEVRLRALRHKEQRLLATNQGRFATTINHFGSGSRSYVHSEDHSINFIGSSAENVFSQVREQITALVPETGSREAILARLQDLEDAQPGPSRMERYNQFISAASNHITVLTPILTPFLQWLATHN